MKSIDPQAYLTLEEVSEKVNDLSEKRKHVSGRTIRFYIEKQLLPPVRSGPGKKYPYDTVVKVLFIKLLNTEYGLSLNHLRQTMQSVGVETMQRVLSGEEPLDVGTSADTAVIKQHVSEGYQVVTLEGAPEATAYSQDWEMLLASESVVMKLRPGLSPNKLKQLRQVAELINLILEDD
jgi:DNA-binding transcriptional MerR regulator